MGVRGKYLGLKVEESIGTMYKLLLGGGEIFE